jgi:pimeloyl-ACP methyl ester carboxylesterase
MKNMLTTTDQNRNTCKIIAYGENPKQVFFYLWSLMHRTSWSAGKLKDIITKDFGSTFISVDWPKLSFDDGVIIEQLISTIQEYPDANIVIMGLSFWSLVWEQLLSSLSEEDRKRVIEFISICWVWSSEFIAPLANNKIRMIVKKVSRQVFWLIWGIDRRVWNNWIGWFMVDKNTWLKNGVSEKRLLRHKVLGSHWMNPWLAWRINYMTQSTFSAVKWDIKTTVIYSKNDPTFTDPEKNAKSIKIRHSSASLIELDDSGHAALVENPETYITPIINLLSIYWPQNHNN